MATSKHRKNHKEKKKKRMAKLDNFKKAMEKAKKNFIMKMIEEENKKGLFDNTKEFPVVGDTAEQTDEIISASLENNSDGENGPQISTSI
jgi:hypothetical protein